MKKTRYGIKATPVTGKYPAKPKVLTTAQLDRAIDDVWQATFTAPECLKEGLLNAHAILCAVAFGKVEQLTEEDIFKATKLE